jgi:hypothetical protein
MCNVGIKTASPQYDLDVNGTARFAGNTYVQGSLGVGTLTPSQKLQVEGNSLLNGVVYVNPGAGGRVHVKDTGTNGDGFPQFGMGYSAGNVGLSGDELRFYNNDGNSLIMFTDAASNSEFAYPYANENEGGSPANWSSSDPGGREGFVSGALCPTVAVSCNLRIPGNCAVNTVNAWSYCGNTAKITRMFSLDIESSNARLGTVRSDNYQTSTGMAFTSDKRLKDKIVPANLDMCYSNVQNLELKYFKWRDDVTVETTEDRHVLGWIAQEVEQVFPKSVKKTYAHGLKNCKALNKEQLMASLYGTVQKLQTMYEEQSEILQAVVADNVELRARVDAHTKLLNT